MITKQKTIDQLFVNLSSINGINHCNSNKDEIVIVGDNHSNNNNKDNQFNKFHEIDKRMKQSMSQHQQNNS